MKPKISVLVTVDDRKFDFHQVARSLEDAGLEKVDAMPFSGIVGGITDQEKIDALKSVPGVQAVEQQTASHAY